jgi:2-dehydro-3-deoxyphosphogluconate aldolase/(4S)-4-hydroxy-2-oxoglutarate aldolase
MKSPFLGTHGHIAVGVVGNVERGVYHLERQGFVFDTKTAKRDPQGGLVAIYLAEEIAGFAVHLVAKK